MKATYNWLKDFVDIKLAVDKLADKLTMAGLEVKSVEHKNSDAVFEIEITSNRPDWLSIIGIAREIAAITKSKVKSQKSKVKPKRGKLKEKVRISVQSKEDCPLYTAKIIKNIKVAPSPAWLRERIELLGLRSINNVVDITNYILFELGEPLHAFDLDKLSGGEIVVRRAKGNERITTIDGQEMVLGEDILVIADQEKPVAVAGVMGGKYAEVTGETKNILLEAAIFNPIIVRRGRQKLGLQSDSSYRFERGIDPQVVEQASCYAVEMIEQISGGSLSAASCYGQAKIKEKKIALDMNSVKRILGPALSLNKTKSILTGLGFKVKHKSSSRLLVAIPSYRSDVIGEIDLVEELARIYGYENFPNTLPKITPSVDSNLSATFTSTIKKTLVSLGLNEAITYSLVNEDLLKAFGINAKPVYILNPLSSDQGILRPNIYPSLCACVAFNLNQKQEYVNLFEVSRVFLNSYPIPKEELSLGIALCGENAYIWQDGLVKERASFLQLKGILERLFSKLDIEEYDFISGENISRIDVCADKTKIGFMMKLDQKALAKIGVKNKDVFCAEISLEKLMTFTRSKKNFTPAPKYPAIIRDISFVVQDTVSVKEIFDAIKNQAGILISDIKIIDYYKGKQIPQGYRGLTISCIYRLNQRTLTEEEITPLHLSISSLIEKKFGAKIR